MEDTHVLFCEGKRLIGAVFDGHSGGAWSVACAEQFESAYHDTPATFPDDTRLKDALAALDSPASGGAVAVAFTLHDNLLVVANCGDAELAFVGDLGTVEVLTTKHSIHNPFEVQRLINAGALIRKPYFYDPETGRGLMPTRSLGDREFERVGLLHDAQTKHRFLTESGWIIAACDGLWDVVDAAELRVLINGQTDPDALVAHLVTVAYQRRSSDNVTVMAARFTSDDRP